MSSSRIPLKLHFHKFTLVAICRSVLKGKGEKAGKKFLN
jgi:hypothetical protein